MPTTEETENEIVAKLVADINDPEPQYDIKAFPDEVGNYRLSHPDGAMLVAYKGARFGESDTVAAINQVSTLEFFVYVISRNLHSHKGAYAMLDAVRASLTGFKPTGMSQMRPSREEIISRETGIWRYAAVYRVNGRNNES